MSEPLLIVRDMAIVGDWRIVVTRGPFGYSVAFPRRDYAPMRLSWWDSLRFRWWAGKQVRA